MLRVVLRWNKEAFRWMMLDLETRSFEIVDMPTCERFRIWTNGLVLKKDSDNVVTLPSPILEGYETI